MDGREPHGPDDLLHPRAAFGPKEVRVVCGTHATGGVALAALPDGAAVERMMFSEA